MSDEMSSFGDPANPEGGATPGGEATPPAGAPPVRPPTVWAATDAVSYGIAAIKKDPMIILVTGVALVLMQAITIVNQFLQAGLGSSPDDTARAIGLLLGVLLPLANLAVQAYVMMGLTRYILKVLRGQPGGVEDLFGPGPFLQMLAALFLGGLATAIGCCLLIVPGIIVGLGIMFYAYILIDRERDCISALKESWELTNGHKGQLFVFMLLAILLSLAGFLLCGVGVFLSNAIISVGMGWIYMRLTGQKVVDMAPAA